MFKEFRQLSFEQKLAVIAVTLLLYGISFGVEHLQRKTSSSESNIPAQKSTAP